MRPRSALRYSLLLLAFAASAAIQAQPKTLAVCTEAAPEGFDPARYTSGYTFDASAHPLYNALAAFAPGSATVIPALAESWDVSADGLVYTFRLRQGVKFHSTDYFKPTREFDADDVLFSFQRMLDPQHPAHDLSPSGYPYADAMQLRDIIERIEKIDEHQVRFVLKHPEAPFLADLAMPFGSILSAEYAGQLIARGKGYELNSKPIGTGPFVFTRYRKDAQVRYAANPDYWKGKPAIDHLVLAITLDPNVRVQRLRRNECQIALTPKPEDVAALRQDPQLTVLEEAAMITSHAAINTRHEPFDDPRVRRAIAMGFNKSSYLKIVFGDQARLAIGPYPPMLLGYDDSIRDWPYDPERAKALLKEAGVTPDTPLNLYISTGSGPGGNPARVAQLIQSDLAAIGIRVNIRQFEWGEMVKRTKAGEHDMMLYSWIGDNGDPDNFLTHNLGCASVESGENRARWCDKGFDEAIRKARMSNDESQRVALYKEAQRIFHEQMPWLPLAHPLMFDAQRKNVSGYRMSPMSARDFSRVKLD
ncbi:ABC transporter substrate-binding protein [Pseudomonas aeruginosa]|uniref:ABC transporter substrate-binding protein n=1 Tax=Pseudomonas aeruginosa TaxID=287 RepID=UPI000E35C6AE|nr:ABC transporter substrate-binding protein [Pseudomonas aeruginosa]AXR13250.1 ABC transporter substrate-binding protein [Pseudomonas aeruginosa]MBG4226135.1 ABC transporter substrate-binding protein [Pseudomonas aeruginosa]MBG4238935.1 ABC transporter substrate-binding protein [Pseudomonas aeruginosa]MBH3601489.1 ABC transporter substrate-binding protein [Pseudomonas aeruginosa]MBH4221652.1 ABC transporter substrate-binding protein [Pseudomonas aeruginosa]